MAIEYTATFIADGEVVDTVKFTVEDESITKPAVPEKTGYAGKWEDYTLTAEDITINAVYKAIEYTITYELNGGTNDESNPATYTVEDEVSLATPTRPGYSFLGWSDGGKIAKGSTGDKTFTASWEVITYNISYELNGGTNAENNPATYTIESDAITLSAPTRDYYTFIGWEEGNVLPAGSFGNKVFTAKWQAIEYTITYELDGGTNNENNPATYTVESDTITLAAPFKRGYTFNGWSDGGVIEKGSHGNKTFTAFYTAKWFKFSVETSSLATINAQMSGTYESGTPLYAEIKDLYRGYQFDGWYNGNILLSKDSYYEFSIIDSDIRLSARISVLPEMRIFKFESSVETCEITGLYDDTTITSLVIPGYVTKIGDSAFKDCTAITTATIPNSVTAILSGAFNGCRNLTRITIPDSVTSIGESAFGSCSSLTSITIPNGVTAIADWTFSSCSNLASIVIPDSVTSIGGGAFSGCSSLTSVTIPDSVTSIGGAAFSGCSSLTSVTIPSSMASIGGAAFRDCSSLTSVTIPDSVTSIGISAFEGCSSLTSVTIPDSVTSIGYSAFSGCRSLTSVTIPNSVTSIGGAAFENCSSLTSITIPAGVTSIGDNAFLGCVNLAEVINYSSLNITAGSTDYGYVAYYASVVKNGETGDTDTSHYSFETYDGVTYLVGYTGTDTDLILPDSYNGKSYGIYANAFCECTDLTSVVIPNGVTSIGEFAFWGCSSLTSITIPDSVTSIGDSAFKNCSSLTSITIPDGVTSIGGAAFYGCSNLTSVIWNAKNCTKAGFYNCSSLTDVTIGKNVKAIPSSAFEGCRSLASVNYLGTIDQWVAINFDGVNANPLSYAHNLYINNQLVTTANLTTATKISAFAFYNCSSLTSVIIPDRVASIGLQAFFGCSSLASVTIPGRVVSIGWQAFAGCSSLTSVNYLGTIDQWARIEFNDSGANPLSYAHNLYINNELVTTANLTTATKISAHAFSGCSSLMSIIIPDSVTSIGGSAFYNCSSLTSIIIPDSVTSIGWSVFEGCSSLTSVIWNAKNCIEVGNSSFPIFKDCSSLTDVTIGKNVKAIPSSAFSGCSSLTSVNYLGTIDQWAEINYGQGGNPLSYAHNLYINNELVTEANLTTATKISAYAFYGCSRLTSVTIPDSVTSIESCAFYDCSRLESVTIGNSVTSIGSYAFSGCNSLASVTIGNGVTLIGGSAFSDCSSLTSVNYLGTINQWAEIDFNNYDANPLSYAHNLYINNQLVTTANLTTATKISDYAFSGCSSLKSITIPDSVTSIGYSAFRDCSSLTSVTIPSSVASIGGAAFRDCSSLTSVTIPNSVTSIGGEAFSGCSSLTSVTIPDSVTSIGYSAFSGCSSLTSVTIGNGVTSIGNSAFEGCNRLASVTIGNSATSIGNSAFEGCNRLASVTIGNSATSIGRRAFGDCSSLTSVTIPDSVTVISESAFDGCSSLKNIYYKGTAAQWDKISIDSYNDYLIFADRYYYSETAPALNSDGTAYDGNYWHYDSDGKTPIIWKKEN